MKIEGTWHGAFYSSRDIIHHFTLVLKPEGITSLHLKRANPDPRNGDMGIPCNVQAKVTEIDGHQFVALLAEDAEGMLFTTTLKAVNDKGILHGPLVFSSLHSHDIDQQEIVWTRTIPREESREWYATFVSPSGNLHWFMLYLSPTLTEAKLELKVKRKDGLEINPNIKVHIECSGPFIAMLAKDQNEPNGMVSMILHPDGPDLMRGQMIWNSLTDGSAGTVRIKESKEIVWTTKPPEDHPATTPFK